MEVLTNSNGIEFLGYYNEAFDVDEIPKSGNDPNVKNKYIIVSETGNHIEDVTTSGKLKQFYESVVRRSKKQKFSHPINNNEQTFPKLDIIGINLNNDNQIEITKVGNSNKQSFLKANMTGNFNSEGKFDSNTVFQGHHNKGFDFSSEDLDNDSRGAEQTRVPQGWAKKKEQPSDIEHKYRNEPVYWTQIFGALSSATVHLAVGCIVGFTGVTLPSLMDPLSDDIVLDKYQASIFSSIVNVGAMAGSVLSSAMMTWLGQRSTLLIYLPVGIVFWIGMSLAQSFWLLILSRVIQGIVMGVCAGCANNYVVETAHKSVRGRLMAFTDLCLQLGFLFMYIVGSSGLKWRNVGLICGIISMAMPFIGMTFLPHSPRWLALYGRKEEARKSLIFFRGKDYDVASELNEIEKQLEISSKGATTVLDQLKMMTERSIAFRLLILAVLLFASHFTGNFALIAYSVSIFESAELEMSPYLSTIIVACARIIGVVIYITIADKFQRRPLFMIPLSLSGLAMLALGFFFFVKAHVPDTSFISWLPLGSVIFYVIFTMMSHPVLMLLRSELLPTTVRSVGVGILYLAFFLGTFCVSLSYPYMVDSIGSHWTFWLYGVTSFIMVLITAVSIPETQGKSLEDIDNLFAKNKITEPV